MKKLFLIPILTLLLLSGLITPAVSQHKDKAVGSSQAVQMLFQHSKINAPESVLKDFVNGEQKTRVIVNLRKPLNTNQFNNLKNRDVRKQLKQAVKETQNWIVPMLNTQEIRITNEFTYVFGFSAEVSLEGLTDLIDHPDIISIEEDAILYPNLNQGISLMNASTVRKSYNGAGMSIAICDTGIDYTHPKLGGGGFPNTKVIGGWDCGDDDSNPMDSEGHGTACAGIAAGDLGTTGDYIGGVAYGAKLYAIKISKANGVATTSDMIEGWEWCVTHQNDDPANPIMIISTSFGGGRFYSTCDSESTAMTAAAANAVSAGITLFASSGNDGYCDSMGWPACNSDVISVGAVYDAALGQNPPPGYVGCISNESCVGTLGPPCDEKYYVDSPANADMVTSYSNSSSFLDLFAPSEWTTTTKLGGGYWDTSNGFGGTSAACPYAAGAAALLQSANKAKQGVFLTPAEVKSKLIDYGDSITDGKVSITKPRVNLGDSIASITIEAIDTDNDGILDDGDNSGIAGDNTCAGGNIIFCDDNCPSICNLNQLDTDVDGLGDVCDDSPGCGGCGEPTCGVSCDLDADGILNSEDNCRDLANFDQENADNDTLGDVCDADTVYGYISGDIIEDVNVELYQSSCGGDVLLNTLTTNLEGYYAFGSLDNGTYSIVPDNASYIFNPDTRSVKIPRTTIYSQNFTATSKDLNTIASINDNMVSISGGTFQMGCTPGDTECDSNGSPRHSVTLSSFKIGKYEVTQGQWEEVMGSNPSYFDTCGDNCPVEKVSWNDTQTFITDLNSQTGQSYRLCTEAEWEYAARAGTETKWYCGDDESCVDDIAWYNSNSGSKTHPAGQKDPNAWGLHDMSGNVWEWVNDWYGTYPSGSVTNPTGPVSGSYRVNRGGSWYDYARLCRSANRSRYSSSYGNGNLGFRLCR